MSLDYLIIIGKLEIREMKWHILSRNKDMGRMKEKMLMVIQNRYGSMNGIEE